MRPRVSRLTVGAFVAPAQSWGAPGRHKGSASMPYLIGILIGLAVGAGAVLAYLQFAANSTLARARTEAEQMRQNAIKEAENRAKEIELAARQEQLKLKSQFEREQETSRRKLEEHENRLSKREDTLDRKLDTLSVKEKHLDDLENKLERREKTVKAKEEELTGILKEQRDRLLQIAGMTAEQAREVL